MKYVQQNKLFRDVESLSRRFAAAIKPERPTASMDPGRECVRGCARSARRHVGCLGNAHRGRGISRRLVAAFAPVVLDIPLGSPRLPFRYIPRDRAASSFRGALRSRWPTASAIRATSSPK